MQRLPTGRQSKDLQGIPGILFKRLMNEIRVRPLSLPRRTPPPSSFQEWLHAWGLNGLFSCKSAAPGWRLCQRVRIIIPLSLT